MRFPTSVASRAAVAATTATLALAAPLHTAAAATTTRPAASPATISGTVKPKPARRAPATTIPTSATVGSFLHMTAPDYTGIGAAHQVVLQQHQYAQIPAIRKANPSAKIYFYSNMSAASVAAGSGAYQPSVVTYPQLQAHPAWALKGANGSPARWADYAYLQPFDVGNPEVQRAAVANLKAELTAHDWDGVMLDDANTSLDGHAWTATPTNLTGGSVYAASTSFLQAVTPALRSTGKKVAINMETAWNTWKPQVTAWAPLVDAVNLEHCSSWTEGATKDPSAYLSGLDAAWRLDEMRTIQSLGSTVWCHDYVGVKDVRASRYARALFLVGWDGRSASATMLTPGGWSGPTPTAPADLDLGAPSAAADTPVAGVYRRSFAKGTLYLNTLRTAVTVATPTGDLTLAPLTAAVR